MTLVVFKSKDEDNLACVRDYCLAYMSKRPKRALPSVKRLLKRVSRCPS
jgi:hypothetical protein